LGGISTAVFGYGFLRLNFVLATESVRVAGITANADTALGKLVAEVTDRAAAQLLVQAHREAYFSKTAREARAGGA
jgi:hypothetical protein